MGAVNKVFLSLQLARYVCSVHSLNIHQYPSSLSFMPFQVAEDHSYVAQVQNIFSYFHGVPGFLLPHPTSSSPIIPFKLHEFNHCSPHYTPPSHTVHSSLSTMEHLYNTNFNQQLMITSSMSSLEALLSKLPSVVPTPSPPLLHLHDYSPLSFLSPHKPLELVGARRK